VHAEPEQAQLVQGQRRRAGRRDARRERLHRVVVGRDGGNSTVPDPCLQVGVGAVEGRADVQRLGGGVTVAAQHLAGEPGVQHQQVAGFDDDLVGRQHGRELFEVDDRAPGSEVGLEVDQDRPALDAVAGHVADVHRAGVGGGGVALGDAVEPAEAAQARLLDLGGADGVDPGAPAVVVDRLRDAVLVGVETGAGVAEGVPLRGVLGVQHHQVVAHHVAGPGHGDGHVAVEVDRSRPQRGAQDRREPVRVEDVAARPVQRQ
jgi:hypothetical protein